MEPRDFVYWLQGYLEISGTTNIDAVGLDVIKSHLDLVLTNKTKEFVFNPPSQTTDPSFDIPKQPGIIYCSTDTTKVDPFKPAYCATTSDVSKRIRQ